MSPQLSRLSLSCLLLVPTLLACGRSLSTEPTALKDFINPDLYATGLGGTVSISIGMGWEGPNEEFCPQLLPDARATVDGQPLVLEERGQAVNVQFSDICRIPMFRRTGPWKPQQDAVSTLEVTDGTRTLTMKVKGLGIHRTARIVEPASQLLTVGEEVIIEWLPATDVLDPSEVLVSLWSIPTQGKDVANLRGDALRIEGNRIHFTMPEFPKGKLSMEVFTGHSGAIVFCNARCGAPEARVTILDAEVL
jgi:hypothetical protein